MREEGYISNWNEKGFGFIKRYFNRDVFVHISQLPVGIEVTNKTYISFEIEETHKGLCAVNIQDKTKEEEIKLETLRIEREEEDRIYREFEKEITNKYKSELDDVNKMCKKTPSEILLYNEALRKIENKIKKEFDDSDYEYWNSNISHSIPDSEDILEDIRECDRCEEYFEKEEINQNWIHHRIYQCDDCLILTVDELKSTMEKLESSIDLNAIQTKKQLKELVKKILKTYKNCYVKDMGEKSRLIVSAILSEGDYNVGYFMPKGGSTRPWTATNGRLGDWYSSGSHLRASVSWRSRKGNWCSDSQTFKTMGSIDDYYNDIIKIIKQ